MKNIKYDFLVIGSGLSGLYFSLLASKHGSVALITKNTLGSGASILAQGGVAASMSQSDTPENHFDDTLKAGAGLCDPDLVKILVNEGVDRIHELVELGVEFTRNKEGLLDLALEGGHSMKRVVHSRDQTGRVIHQHLAHIVKSIPEITIYEHYMAVDLITDHQISISGDNNQKKCFGAYIFNMKTGSTEYITAENTILATGGAGTIYPSTTNPPEATGDGVAMAYRSGCRVRNLEFIQFHPTAFYSESNTSAFLISEAVRGKGGKLKTLSGEYFMEKYDPRKDLAPRDIVARAIDSELKISGDKHILLDVTEIPENELKEHFPHILKTLMERYQLDITKTSIPVIPAAHYFCGGILVDQDARTDLKNLYALGETASNGIHGANRLASNSLLECLVFGHRALNYILKYHNENSAFNIPDWINEGTKRIQDRGILKHHKEEIQSIMWNYIGIVRSATRLKRALKIIDIIYEEIIDYYKNSELDRDLLELRNMALVAQLVIRSAESRHESRGLHYMIDYPETRTESRIDTVLVPTNYSPV